MAVTSAGGGAGGSADLCGDVPESDPDVGQALPERASAGWSKAVTGSRNDAQFQRAQGTRRGVGHGAGQEIDFHHAIGIDRAQAALTARSPATVEEVLVRPGHLVEVGTVLVRMYNVDENDGLLRASREFDLQLVRMLRILCESV